MATATARDASSATDDSRWGDRPLRVLMLTDCFPKPTIPVMGVWALQQARGLVSVGAEVQVLSPTSWIPPLLRSRPTAKRFHDCPKSFDWDGITTLYPRWPFYSADRARRYWAPRPLPFVRFARLFIGKSIKRALRQWRPDVIFAHHVVPGGLTALWIKKKFGIPYIVQDFEFGSVESCAELPKRRVAFEAVIKGAWASLGASGQIARAYTVLVPGARAMPLYTGTHRPPPELSQVPRPPEIAGKFVIFSAASFYVRKGVPLMIRAFAEVARRHPNICLRIAGTGPDMPAVEAALAEVKLGDRIQMLGMLPHERVIQEMVWCDLFMLVGWSEPFATVYLEAMSARKPIICCNDGGICEVMQDGMHGISVPPKDQPAAAAALEKLLADNALRDRMGQAAGELFSERLTLEASARTALRVLHEAARSAGSPAT